MALKQDLNPPPGQMGQQFIERDSFSLMRHAYAFLQALYNRHNYVDLSWYIPGVLVVGLQVFRYPCPPVVEVKPTEIIMTLGTAPAGANVIVQVWRSALAATAAKPAIPGAMLATVTFFAPSQNGFSVYVDDDNVLIPGTEIFVVVTQVGAVTPGSDLHILIRG